MNQQAQKVEQNDDDIDAEIAALIGDATNVTAEAVSGPTAYADIDMEALEAEATAAEIKSTAYKEQEAEQPAAGNDDPSNVTPITTAKTSRAPRVSRAAGAKASAVLSSVMDEPALLRVACLVNGDVEDVSTVDTLKSTVDNLAKKVGDKAVNLLRWQHDPKKLQGYTRLGVEHLLEHSTISSKSLTEHFQKSGYTIGTARSQANQLMSLLPALKVASKSGRELTVNADSTIVASFQSAAAAA